MRRRICLALPLAALVLLSACGHAPEINRTTRADLLGTVITISTYETPDEAVLEGVFDLVAEIDARMTTHSKNSEVGRLNTGGAERVPASAELCALMREAGGYATLSGGAFDPSIGSVSELWKQDGAFAVLPDPAAIEERLPLVNHRFIRVFEDEIALGEGVKLDLGAIAKGYACDRALQYLAQQGVQSALLDFGGNIYAHGVKPDGSPWRVGIAVPLAGESGSACSIAATDLAVVTSGGYERYFEQDGVLYHHILDPATGYPAQSGLLSVTVLDPSATRADALSTACYVLGLTRGMALLEQVAGCEGIFITPDKKVHTTTGLTGAITVLDERFVPANGG